MVQSARRKVYGGTVQNRIEYLRSKAGELPLRPGVYLMKNKNGDIIYVGKSKKLKNRVTSYFINTAHNYKTERMVSQVCDFDTILCDSEIEALALENTLIKKHNPKYNIRLKDSKSYPYIKITNEEYPKIIVTRKRSDDRATYLGPYSGMTVANDAVETVRRAFGLPSCKRVFPRDIGKERPCIYKQMGRCIAPCTGEIGKEEYRERIENARHVLNGNIRRTVEVLTERMCKCADEERFEEAARLRDTIKSLQSLKDRQKVVMDAGSQKDVWAYYVCDMCSVISVLSIRDGALNAKNDYLFGASELMDGETFCTFICNYYADNVPPTEILLANGTGEDSLSLIGEYIRTVYGRKSDVRIPQKGDMKKLCEMAVSNAKQRADKYISDAEKSDAAVARLASLTGLEVFPDRIEAYDISNLGSEHITAGMIVYEDGNFKKSDYRQFKIKNVMQNDDYASMREALTRRLSHIGDGSPSLSTAPDLILLDGGVGHVNTVKEVLAEMNCDISVFGMVKDDYHKTRTLTDGEKEISIAGENTVFVLLYKIQEEVHRYTIGVMRKAKRKTLKHSVLEEIEGIGSVKAKKLLLRFGSVKHISSLGADELTGKDITRKDAVNIVKYFEKERAGGVLSGDTENDENNNR